MSAAIAVRRIINSPFARNWSALTLSGLAVQALSLLTGIRIARALEPAGYGQYNLVMAQAALVATICYLGFRHVIVRSVARIPEQSATLLIAAASLRAIAFIVAALALWTYNRTGKGDLSAFQFQMAAIIIASSSLWDLVESFAFGHQKMGYTAWINLGASVLWVAIIFSLPTAALTPNTVLLATTVLQAAKAILYGGIAWRAHLFSGQTDPGRWQVEATDLMRQSLPFFWLSLLTVSITQLPVLLLGARSGAAEVGLYNVGFRLLNPMQIVLATSLTALYPGLARLSVFDAGRFQQTVRRALLTLVILGASVALVVSLLRTEVVFVLFGPAYAVTADNLSIQCWYVAIQAIYSLIGTVLAARDRQKWLAALSTFYALTTIPLLWFGAGYGALGLAIASLVGTVFGMTYHWYFFQKSLPERLSARFTAMLFGILGGGAILAWLVPQLWLWPVRSMIAAILVIAIFIVSGVWHDFRARLNATGSSIVH